MVTKAKDCASEFARVALPKQFCNLDRLLFALELRGLDGIVATLPYNVFYLSGLNAVAHKADEPRPVCCGPVAARAWEPDPGGGRLLSGDLSDPADLGGGYPAVPRRDDAARPAPEPDGHRPLHPARHGRHGVAEPRAAQLRLRHGHGLARRLEGPAARSRPPGVRRHGRRRQARHRGPGGDRWLRCAHVRACGKDRHGAAPAGTLHASQRDGHPSHGGGVGQGRHVARSQ